MSRMPTEGPLRKADPDVGAAGLHVHIPWSGRREPAVADRALVLGGGGVTGIAWMLGVLHGLAEAGVDLTQAEVVVGTSAGSAVGAQITSGEPVDVLYDRQLQDPTGELAAKISLFTILRW